MGENAKKVNVTKLSILSIEIEEGYLKAGISDGRFISIPISWFERLSSASTEELVNFEISPGGYGIHWPDLDEDISIQSFFSES